MKIYLAEKLRALRAEKGVSQEKLAEYLNVSFQAVSKWENSATYPDITLLPEIARFFGITVDALLQTERINEDKLFAEYEHRTFEAFRSGNRKDALAIWQEAYHKMPNSLAVKEYLMSSYFDVDKIKYKQEIIELASELYNTSLTPEADHTNNRSKHSYSYYRGQAIDQMARTYAANGDQQNAEKWAERASYLIHSQEFLSVEITHGKDRQEYFTFANHWYFENLFYMACRVAEDEKLSENGYAQAVFESLTKLYEIVYPCDDMDFESLEKLCMMHRMCAEDEANGKRDEAVIQKHLTRAMQCAKRSLTITAHTLTHPLVKDRKIADAPANDKKIVLTLQKELQWSCFDAYRHTDWFSVIENELNTLL